MTSYIVPADEVLRVAGIIEGEGFEQLYYSALRSVAIAIKDYQKENRVTNKELAKKAGVTTSVLSRVLCANQNISVKTICRIFAVTGNKLHCGDEDVL